MKRLLPILLLSGLTLLASCRRKHTEGVYDPLVMKYLAYPSGILIQKVYDGDSFPTVYAVSGMWGGVSGWDGELHERKQLSWRNDGIFTTGKMEYRIYPELTDILRKNGTIVSNGFVARDIRDLFEVVMKTPNDVTRDYLVESVSRTSDVWVVEAKYWGNVDDSHRRPSRIVHRISVNQSNQLENVVEEIHPRPMDMESWKHRTNASTPTK